MRAINSAVVLLGRLVIFMRVSIKFPFSEILHFRNTSSDPWANLDLPGAGWKTRSWSPSFRNANLSLQPPEIMIGALVSGGGFARGLSRPRPFSCRPTDYSYGAGDF